MGRDRNNNHRYCLVRYSPIPARRAESVRLTDLFAPPYCRRDWDENLPQICVTVIYCTISRRAWIPLLPLAPTAYALCAPSVIQSTPPDLRKQRCSDQAGQSACIDPRATRVLILPFSFCPMPSIHSGNAPRDVSSAPGRLRFFSCTGQAGVGGVNVLYFRSACRLPFMRYPRSVG